MVFRLVINIDVRLAKVPLQRGVERLDKPLAALCGLATLACGGALWLAWGAAACCADSNEKSNVVYDIFVEKRRCHDEARARSKCAKEMPVVVVRGLL